MFDEIIINNKQNIINTLCELIKFKSVSNETNNSTMPFGKECKNVLEYTLNLAKSLFMSATTFALSAFSRLTDFMTGGCVVLCDL